MRTTQDRLIALAIGTLLFAGIVGHRTWQRNQSIRLLSDKVVTVVKEQPDRNAHRIIFQNYIIHDKSYIYVFSSTAVFKDSELSQTLDRPLIWIDRSAFLSLLRDSDGVIINPGTKSELLTSVKELKKHFLARPDLKVQRTDHPPA